MTFLKKYHRLKNYLLGIIGCLLSITFFTQTNMTAQNNFQLYSQQIFTPENDALVQFYQYRNYQQPKAPFSNVFQFSLYKVKDIQAFLNDNAAPGTQVFLKEEDLSKLDKIKTWEENIVANRNYGRNQVSLGKLKEGIYIVEALTSDGQVAQVPVFVSKFGIVTRTVGTEVIGYVHDLKNGKAQNGFAPVVLFNKEKRAPAEVQDGVFCFDLEDLKSNNQVPIIAFNKNNQFAVSQAYINYYYIQQNSGIKSYVFTDRSAYRPEQTVLLKGMFRQKDGFAYQVVNEEIIVKITNSQNTEVFKKGFTLDEFGSFAADFVLGSDAALGEYVITVSPKDEANNQNRYWWYNNQNRFTFKVEEYKKPEYEVLVKMDKSQYVNGDEITASISAQYFFGSPVQNAEVNYRVVRQPFYFPWYRYMRCYWWYADYYQNQYGSETIKSETVKIGEDGKIDVSFKTDNNPNNQNYRYYVYADVRDASRRTITGSGSAIVAHTEFSLTAHSEQYYYETGEKISVRVAAVDYNQSPIETEFKAELSRHFNGSTKSKQNLTGITNKKTGEAFVEFEVNEPGYYYINVSAEDSRGETTTAQANAYVLKEDDYSYRWWQQNGGQIAIMTNKKVYDAGEKIKAMVYVPHETDVLITINNKSLGEYGLYDFSGGKGEGKNRNITFEIDADAYGRMELAVVYFQDNRLYQRTENLTVIPQGQYLDVAIEFDETTYKPRETATATIKVTDEDGKPMPNAQVTLSTADESIFFLYPDKTKDIRQAFYENEQYYTQNQQSTYNSYAQSRMLSPKSVLWRIENNQTGFNRNAYLQPSQWLKTQIVSSEEEGTKTMVSGFLVDYTTGLPIADANITVGGKKFSTNERGYYSIKGFAAGKKSFLFQKGDRETWVSNLEIAEGQHLFLNVGLGDEVKKIDWATLIDIVDRDDMLLDEVMVEDSEELESVVVTGYGAQAEMSMDASNEGDFMAKRSMKSVAAAPAGVQKDKEANQEVYQEATIRDDFKDAIYWNPTVVTDANGEAKVEIYLPDNLTTWRTMAKVITKDTKVGQTVAKTVVRKNLLVRMETPRFMMVGDELLIATNIHNYLSEEKKVKVQLFADGLALNNTEKTIQVAANGEERVDWLVKSNWITKAKLTVKALTNEESDAMEWYVPVKPYGLEVIQAFSANVRDTETEEIIIDVPSDIDISTATLKLSVAPSITAALLGSMDQLIGYPYGCVEQTMSRFLPNVIVGNTLKNLGKEYDSTISLEELDKMTLSGFKRLGQLQHSDGGWGWWAQDASHPFMTAYVCYGMFMAKTAGFQAEENVYKKGMHALRQQIVSGTSDDPTTRAYQMMVAQQMDIPNIWTPAPALEDADAYTVALWLQASVLADDKKSTERLLTKLENMSIKEGRLVYWGGKKFYYRWQDDRVETTANAIKAITMADPDNDLLGDAVQWILQQRKGNAWHNTRQTAMTIYGLQEIIKQEVNPELNLEILVNGLSVLNKKVTQEDVFEQANIIEMTGERLYASTNSETLDLSELSILKSGKNKIEIRQKGRGTHYIGAALTFFADGEKAKKYNTGENLFEVERTYYKLVEQNGKNGTITYEKQKIGFNQINVGDDILVKVKVKTDNQQEYVLIEDPIPAGCEFIRDTKPYSITGENLFDATNSGRRGYWNWWYTHREFRDSHLAITITRMGQGEYAYSYLMKAQIPGNYKIGPTVAQLMYYPENRGYSDFGSVEIRD